MSDYKEIDRDLMLNIGMYMADYKRIEVAQGWNQLKEAIEDSCTDMGEVVDFDALKKAFPKQMGKARDHILVTYCAFNVHHFISEDYLPALEPDD